MNAVLVFILLLLAVNYPVNGYSGEFNIDLKMPDVSPHQEDLYLCNAYHVEQDLQYIVEFDPKPTKHVHHILVFACKVPGHVFNDIKSVWNCPENVNQPGEGYVTAPACAEGAVIYAWAQQAPKLRLPMGVAYRMGRLADVNYIVLQAHYIKVDASTLR